MNNISLLDVIFLVYLQHVVEAGTGIEPVYTDLQWNTIMQIIVFKYLFS